MPSPFANSAITNFLELIGLSAVTPAANRLRLFVRQIAGMALLASKDETGQEWINGAHEGYHKYALWSAAGNSTVVLGTIGCPAFVTTGTPTLRNVANTNRVTRRRRLAYQSTAVAGTLGGHAMAVGQQFMGDGTLGGFHLVSKFNISDAANVAGARMFVGIRQTPNTFLNVEPNTITNCIGIAQISTSNNLQIVYGGSAAQASINLGANFPANDPNAAYTLTLSASPLVSNVVRYELVREGTAFVATGIVTGAAGTALPLSSTAIGYSAWRCNNATALIVGIDFDTAFVGDVS
jgi:multisubunit Na+/H+ antiporter MnhC subunit